MPNPACVAYEAYRTHLLTSGQDLPPWESLPSTEKKAWWQVVRAILNLRSGVTQ